MGNTVIQLRNDTATNWTSANPTLALGEMGLETNTQMVKFGDGTTAWNSLPYFSIIKNNTAANWTSANPILVIGEMGLETDTQMVKFGDGTTAWNSLPYFSVIKNNTAANWTSTNPILALGEMGLETDTQKIKFGNGTTAWNSLSYFGGATSFKYGEYSLSADQTTNIATNNHIEFNTKVGGSLNSPSTGSGQANGVITLPAGKTYKIQLMVCANYSAAGSITVQMYNRTASALFGMALASYSTTFASNNGPQTSLISFITPSVDTDIEVRLTGDNSCNAIKSGYTRLIIEEYNGY